MSSVWNKLTLVDDPHENSTLGLWVEVPCLPPAAPPTVHCAVFIKPPDLNNKPNKRQLTQSHRV